MLTGIVCEVEPAAKTRVAGTVAAALPLTRVIVAPPTGAPVLRVTVVVVPTPPMTVDWVRATSVTVNVSTCRSRVNVAAFFVALMVAVRVVEVSLDVTVKVALVCPELIVTVDGTVAMAVFELDRLMT